MTKSASFPDDNNGLCEGCNGQDTLYQRQRTFPLMLGGGLGLGTIWLCDVCAVKRSQKEPAQPAQTRTQIKPWSAEASTPPAATPTPKSPSSAPSAPYREPPPPCAVCAARATALAQLEKFSAYPACPLCEKNKPVRQWSHPHRNEVRTFTIKSRNRDPWWYLFWRKTYHATPASTPTCSLTGNDSAPLHFHLECTDCDYHWRMRTAKEDA